MPHTEALNTLSQTETIFTTPGEGSTNHSIQDGADCTCFCGALSFSGFYHVFLSYQPDNDNKAYQCIDPEKFLVNWVFFGPKLLSGKARRKFVSAKFYRRNLRHRCHGKAYSDSMDPFFTLLL